MLERKRVQKNAIIAATAALLTGIGIGCAVCGRGAPRDAGHGPQMTSGMHAMPDGSMMANAPEHMGMAEMMAEMNAGLVGKTGDAFDRAFLAEMIVHHEGAVGMAKLALEHAGHQEVKDLAKAIIAAQEKEIAAMRGWEKSWFGMR
jgi:uncharacterized protein (DUF305 family)